MRFIGEACRTDVRNPDLDRAQTTCPESLAVFGDPMADGHTRTLHVTIGRSQLRGHARVVPGGHPAAGEGRLIAWHESLCTAPAGHDGPAGAVFPFLENRPSMTGIISRGGR